MIQFNRIVIALKKLLKAVFRRSIVNFSVDGQDGLRKVARLMLKRRLQSVLFVVTAALAALFEGGTVGLLGLAVSVLVGKTDSVMGIATGRFGSLFDGFLTSISVGGFFLFLVGLAIVAQLFKSMLLFSSQVLGIYLAFGMKREIQRETVAHLMSMSYAQVSKYSPGEMAHIVDQSDVVMEGVYATANVARATMMLGAYAVVMIVMSLKMALVTVICGGLLWLSLNRVVKALRQLAHKSLDARLQLWRWTVEFLNAPRLLRLFNATDYAQDAINRVRDEEINPERKGEAIQAAVKPAIEAITVVGAGMFLIIGFLLAGDGAKSAIPNLFVYVLVIYRLRPHITAFNDFRIKLAWLSRQLELLGGFLRKQNKEFVRIGGDSFNGLRNSIEVRDVSFRYPETDTNVLNNVSFSVPVGSTVALVGSSGAGKSTTVDLLLGLYEPTQGEILVDGNKLSAINLIDWRKHIGVVDQDVFLLNTSVAENIRFARTNASIEEIQAASELAHAHEFVVELKDGYDTVIGERGYKLSGGQQQRIALARALVRNPSILILDEATSALDTISERLIQQALEAMRNVRTVIIIAHRLSTVSKADRIIVLDNGCVVEQGSREKLLTDAGQFAKLWHLQVGQGV
jgi:ATP-binding cassette subfamily B protein/subfamily B ATP-binding cassette protein MsbA